MSLSFLESRSILEKLRASIPLPKFVKMFSLLLIKKTTWLEFAIISFSELLVTFSLLQHEKIQLQRETIIRSSSDNCTYSNGKSGCSDNFKKQY